jgi:SagB-type dehydrogenase family enzyme
MQVEKLPEINQQQILNNILIQRRSVRSYIAQPLNTQQIGHLLWACQGIINHNRRTSPSAGALYPLEIYLIDQHHLAHYNPDAHQLEILTQSDLRAGLARAALDQDFIAQAPITVLITAVYQRVTWKYGEERGTRYVEMEAGHAAQNLLLQATAEGLGSVPVGAFRDDDVASLLSLPDDHVPLYLLPVGHISP